MTFRAIPPLLASALWLAACSDAIPNADPADTAPPPAIEAPADPDVVIDVPGFLLHIEGDEDGGNLEIVAGELEISIRTDEDGAKIDIHAPSTQLNAGDDVRLDEDELGLPFYPGAELAKGARIETEGTRVRVQVLHTEDDRDEVVSFYEQRLEGYEKDRDWGGVEFEWEDGAEERKVHIQREDSKTEIRLVYVKSD